MEPKKKTTSLSYNDNLCGDVLYIGDNSSNLAKALQDKGVNVHNPIPLDCSIKRQIIQNQIILSQCSRLVLDEGCDKNPTKELLVCSAKLMGIEVYSYTLRPKIQALSSSIKKRMNASLASIVARKKGRLESYARSIFAGIAYYQFGHTIREIARIEWESYKNVYNDLVKFNALYKMNTEFRLLADDITLKLITV